jgi:hypothetical protein
MNSRGLATVLIVLCASAALADDAGMGCRQCCRTSDCPSLGGSPDDYCRKNIPCLGCVPRCGGPDDYCRKNIPCLGCVPRCGGPDDYCRKNIPCLLCPPLSPYLYYSGGSSPCCPQGKR